jgi:hypothetical protein
MASAACFSKLSRPMLPPAYFGIESSGLNLAVDLVFLFIAVLYFSLIYWTYSDAKRRIEDPMLVGCATAAACFPFVGAIIYLIVRPPEFLEDVRERELETQAAEARLHQIDQTLCPHCDYRIEPDFIRCPSCLRKLKERCANCSRPLEQSWTICPYCEADVPGLASPRTRRRRNSAPATIENQLTELDDSLPREQVEDAEEPAAPVAASESPSRSSGGRARRPGRTRPTS